MDGLGRPNPFDRSHISGSSHSLHAAHHQEQSDAQSLLVSPASSISRPLVASPAFISNQPALWQLGRHSWYTSGDDKNQPPSGTHEDRSPPSRPTFFTQAADYQKDVQQVSYDLGGTNEAQLRDVEEELHRGLKARQISMIALGGAIGIGLVIGTGSALKQGGPLGLFLGFSFVGIVCFCLMQSIGEMTTYLPHKKGFAGYTTRFWHPAWGFALGWNYLLLWLVVCPNTINAASVVISWWDPNKNIPPAAVMSVFLCFTISVNLLGIRVFGELEFWLSSIKVLTLIGLILFGIIVDLGGNPRHDQIGFRYWRDPGPMGQYLEEAVGEGKLATFLGFWSVMVTALYSYMGIELIGVTVGEAENPRKNIPKAIRRTFFRIAVFYIGGAFVIGLIVPSNAEVFGAGKASSAVAASPFVHAANTLQVRGLANIVNAALLVFVVSAANSDLYIASRTMYSLALLGHAPRIFRKVTRRGVPIWALLMCWIFTMLVFLNVAEGSHNVFSHLVGAAVTFGGITWMCILYTHIRFMKGLAARKISRDTLPYKALFQPYGLWFALITTGIMILFKGYDTFIHSKDEPFKAPEFISAYIGFPVFFLFFAFWKWKKEDTTVAYASMDLFTGKQDIDDEEEAYLEAQNLRGPRPRWKRLWDEL